MHVRVTIGQTVLLELALVITNPFNIYFLCFQPIVLRLTEDGFYEAILDLSHMEAAAFCQCKRAHSFHCPVICRPNC